MNAESKTDSQPRTRPSSPSLRQRSKGKRGVDAKRLKARLKAKMYRGQKIKNRRPKAIADFLGIDVSAVIAMNDEARLQISALMELNNSVYVGPQAKKHRVLRDKIMNGEFEMAADMLNAPFKKRMELEMNNPPPEWNDIKEPKIKISIKEKCQEGGLSKGQTEAVIAQLQAVEKHLRVDSKCGNDFLEAYKQEEREKQRKKIKEVIRKTDQDSIKKAQKARQELLKMNEVTLTPNVEKQEEARRNLQNEAARKIVGEYSERFDNIQSVLAESRDIQQRLEDDAKATEDYQKDLNEKLKKWHNKQMTGIKEAMTYLKKIDYNTTESEFYTRLNREPGFSNLGGLIWIGKDLMKIVTSIFLDETNQVKLSAIRPLKQSFTALVTLLEVLAKNFVGTIKFGWGGLNCFKSSPLSCLAMFMIKALTIAMSLTIFTIAFPTLTSILNTLLDYIIWGIQGACRLMYNMSKWMFGDIVGKAFEQWSTAVSDFVSELGNWIMDKAINPAIDGITNAISSFLSRMIDSLLPAFMRGGSANAQVIKAAGEAAGEAVGEAAGGSWWSWITGSLAEIDDPHFQKWLSTNPHFQRMFKMHGIPYALKTTRLKPINEEDGEQVYNLTNKMSQITLRF